MNQLSSRHVAIFFISSGMLLALSPVYGDPASPAFSDPPAAQYFRDRQRLESLIEEGNVSEAYRLVQSLNARVANDSMQWWQQGNLAARLEKWSESAYAFERSMALGSVVEELTARRIAEAYALAGSKTLALDWLERAVESGLARRFDLPDNPAFTDYVGDARFDRIAGIVENKITDRNARWVFDIDTLLSEMKRMHASPQQPAYSDQLQASAATLKQDIARLSDDQITMELQRLVALLGDGHSYVRVTRTNERALSPAQIDTRTLPVVFHLFDEDIHVINGMESGKDLVGGQVIAIGDLTTAEFVARALPYVQVDNSETWKFIGVHFGFRRMLLHKAAGSAVGEAVPVKVRFADGRVITRTLQAGVYDFPRKLRPMPGQSAVPLFLENADRRYWTRDFPEYRTIYMQINNIRNSAEGPSLAEFMKTTVNSAIEKKAEDFVVDFRLNNGGNNFLCDVLLRNLLRYEFAGVDNQIFVVTRHETFSAAQNCINMIEAATGAVFVGEPSSSRPNFTGEESEILLPYSGLEVSISNQYWQNSQPWDNRPWISMDIPAPLTFEDYLAGRDAAMEAIFAVIERKRLYPSE